MDRELYSAAQALRAQADALTRMAARAPRVLEVSGGTSRWVPAPQRTGVLSKISPDDKRSILSGASAIPGACIAKLLGATWPMAGAMGLFSAPIVMLVVILATRDADAS